MEVRQRLSGRGWWLTLIVILAVAAALRLTGYNFSLPYDDHPDEPDMYLTALEWRGLFNLENYLGGYPPLYVWLSMGEQIVTEPFGVSGLAENVQILRLVAIGFNLLTLLLIAETARRGGGWIAGTIAGVAWAVAPLVVENGIYAIPDPLVYLLVIASVAFAVVALTDEKRRHWTIWSVVAGCLAILSKYYVLSAILPGIGVTLWLYRRDPPRGRRTLALQAGIIALTLIVAALGMAVLGREGQTARTEGLANLLDPSRVLNNLYYALLPINPLFCAIAAGLGVLAYVIARRAQRIRVDVLILCVLLFISVPWLASTFSVVSATDRLKDVLPATAIACVILGLALAQIAAVLPRLLRVLVLLIPALLVFAPQINADFDLLRNRLLPDTRVALRLWADANLTPGTVLVDAENHKTFNPYWGGIEGQHWFDWIVTSDLTAKSPDLWRSENGASYVEVNEAMTETPDGRAYLSQLLHLRDFISAGTRGPQMQLYRLQPVQHETDVAFGGAIHLIGYDLDAATITPGDSLALTFYWQATSTPTDNYSLFVHLVPRDGDTLVAQADGAPARPERPTLTWTDASETLISQPFTLTVPVDAPAGDYELRIGLYNYQTGVRLPVESPAGGVTDFYALAPISIR